MTTVTIISDWNRGDYYLASLKGALYSLPWRLRLVDITNSVPHFDVLQESFILSSTYWRFPPSSIHLMGVMSEPTEQESMAILFQNGHYFIGLNDGRLSLLFEKSPPIAFEILDWEEREASSFSALSYFVRGVELIIDNKFEQLTKAVEVKSERRATAVVERDAIVGRVIYCDSFGNAITNIKRESFIEQQRGRDFIIFVGGPHFKIERISHFYHEGRVGQRVALFNSLGFLEIAANQANLKELEGVNNSTEVRISFL